MPLPTDKDISPSAWNAALTIDLAIQEYMSGYGIERLKDTAAYSTRTIAQIVQLAINNERKQD